MNNIYNVWHNSQASKTTIQAVSDLAARQAFAAHWEWSPDMVGYWWFIKTLNTEQINRGIK